jgi:hypothetical protein
MNYPEVIARLYDLRQLAELPAPGERSGNCSSYDRASKYDADTDQYIDWGANADGSGLIRMEGKNAVVAELEGPGVIWRVWSAMPKQGHIQIYIDGSDTPALDMPFADYFNNREGMFAYPELVHELSRGRNSYIPIAFAKSCKVVMCEGWGMFYQITHTTFAPGTDVPSFDGEFFSIDGASAPPLPDVVPPICIGANGEKVGLPLVGRVADMWHGSGGSDEEWRRKRAIVDEAASGAGRDPSSISNGITIETPLPETDEESAELLDRIGRQRDLGINQVVMDFGHPLSPEPIHRFHEQVIREL